MVDYDVIVIGGGSGGLAFAKEAGKLGATVAVLDFVKPSPQGTQWGLGGTCVNVGCIPKKLMHRAAIIGEEIKHDASSYGWNVPIDQITHDWSTMVSNIQDHIHSLNWGYKVALQQANVKYINAYGRFLDAHTIECTDKANKKTQIRAQHVVIATGGRPKPPDFPGALDLCISSDDLFSLEKAPGKTLIVGGSYVALECAGLLRGLGMDVTVMVRSILLRGFDQQMAEMIGDHMKSIGVRFIRPTIPSKVEKSGQKLKVFWNEGDTPMAEEFDTVMCAVGRAPLNIGAVEVGVKLHPESGKVITQNDQSSVPSIYAIGDVQHGAPELTPTAIRAGILLARRLFAGSSEQMDYVNVPTAVFTPLEYGSCGFSEEKAKDVFGEENVDVYHSTFKPLEWTVPHTEGDCYCKLIVRNSDSVVIGLHILAPNAGEITQGFGVGIKAGATKALFDSTLGIHPTTAEEFTTLVTTKSSGKSATKGGC